VSVVLALGLFALRVIGSSADEKADKQAQCIQSFGCTGGTGSGPVPIPGAGGPAGADGANGANGAADEGGGGGILSSIGGAFSGAWNWAMTTQNPIVAFVRGAGSEVTGSVQSIAFIVMHPVKSAEGIWYAVNHPILTGQALASEWTDRSLAENLGHVTVMVLEAVTGTLEAKGGTVAAGAARTASEVAEAGSFVAGARVVGELARETAKDLAKSELKGEPLGVPQTASEAKDKARAPENKP
jgi:hypothetical protein